MASVDADQPRPVKKRRFFVDDDDEDDGPSALVSPGPETERVKDRDGDLASVVIDVRGPQAAETFNTELFEAVVGEKLHSEMVEGLQAASGNNMQRAINMFFDGSWRDVAPSAASLATEPSGSGPPATASMPVRSDLEHNRHSQPMQEAAMPPQSTPRDTMPESRYIGAFGVDGWATRSGSGLLRAGEPVRIERQKIQPKPTASKRGGKANSAQPTPSRPAPVNKRADIIVRFTNSRGQEVGRLSKDMAAWISTLLDQNVCKFEGVCFFASDRIRVNDTIYLQLKASLLKKAFDNGAFRLQENNRTTGIFEAKETDEEKDLRLRQVALVKLFDEINLRPTRTSNASEANKRQALLRAAELDERNEKDEASKKGKSVENEASSLPSEDAEDGKELEQDQLDALYKKAESFDFDTPAEEPADTFAMQLRHYQKQALHWMIGKEKHEQIATKEMSMHPLWEEYAWPTQDVNDKPLDTVLGQDSFYVNPYSGGLSLEFPVQEQNCFGGILADEMGLGKTIEMLSLVHTHQSEVALNVAEPGPSSVNDLPRLPRASSSVERAPCTTLVVAPMSLLAQWQSEAEKASQPGTMKTVVYYGNDKAANLQNVCCEANAGTAPQLVITSYGVVLSEFNQVSFNNGNRGSHGGLFSLDFFRVILDEAHHIKNRQSKTAKACYELSAQHRWVLTGTPIVNRLEDLFSLVRFLKVEPWSNFSYWKTFITVPFESKDYVRALEVVQSVLEPLVLRRTKEMKTADGQPLVPLPPKTVLIEEVELSKAEREVYDHIYTMAKRTFAANAAAGTLLKSYTTIFAQILRLRQSCCHPLLVRKKAIAADDEEAAAAAADATTGMADDVDLQELIDRFTNSDGEQDANKYGAHVLQQIQAEYGHECPVCSEEPMMEQTVTGCWHSACKHCLLNYLAHQKEKGERARCFNCREPIDERDLMEVIKHDDGLYDDDEDDAGPRFTLRRISSHPSAKIAALVGHLKRVRREDGTGIKSVVFSQFTSFLDLIEPCLTRDHIPYLRFDGSMAQKQRAAVLAEFAVASAGRRGLVLLLSLRAGGVGLNLTQAQRVYMMDPWWSFAVEAQAIDRVHRMGQEEPVTVCRFVVKDSVEERMLKIQDRKKFIASSLGMMSDDEKRLQTMQDIQDLLS
ncbi:MAG: DNA helicase rad5 [Phylliscum demangeonii]|nr:MAG: DNA helicase rad5 [Phylliscum demangeonii]